MGALLQVLVLVVVAAAAAQNASTTSPRQGKQPIEKLVDACHNTTGEKAAQDLKDSVLGFTPCLEELEVEINMSFATDGVKGVINSLCGRKDHVLQCLDPVADAHKQCWKDRKEVIEFHQEVVKRVIHFKCEHHDDIVKILESTEQLLCGLMVLHKAESCSPFSSQSSEELQENYSKSVEQICKEFDGIAECINGITGRCKNSDILRLINDMKKEVLDEGVCCNGCSAAASLAGVGTLLEPLARLLLALIVTRSLPI